MLVPDELVECLEQYAEDYCFIQNTYYVSMSEFLPKDLGKRMEHTVSYYQWVPIALLLQALMFYMPNRVWELILRKKGGKF